MLIFRIISPLNSCTINVFVYDGGREIETFLSIFSVVKYTKVMVVAGRPAQVCIQWTPIRAQCGASQRATQTVHYSAKKRVEKSEILNWINSLMEMFCCTFYFFFLRCLSLIGRNSRRSRSAHRWHEERWKLVWIVEFVTVLTAQNEMWKIV